jgi:ABC-type Fe3+/spermidine/putrescine transport system ATPase subunit
LWPALNVLDNILYPLKIQKVPRQERRRRVAEIVTALRIDSLARSRPSQLTAPQRLRAALARALVTQPELLVLDAPLARLDPRIREECREDLRRIHVEAAVTILVLTDDASEALALADRLAVMDLGKIIQVGPPQELYCRPHDVFVARMLGPTNLLQGQLETQMNDQKGEVVVRTPLGRLIGQMIPGQTNQGTPVTISVRPETVFVGPSTPAGWNRFPATIERIIFRGELRQIHARGPGDWPIIVSALQSQSQNLREGQSLTLSVAPEHVVVLPGKFAVGKLA